MSFESWLGYQNFRRKIIDDTRYIYDAKTKAFLSEVLESSKGRKEKLNQGYTLWRSQLGGVDDGNDKSSLSIVKPHPKERMLPRKDMAKEGRVNPKGIPCLYLATDKETAMSEARPWQYSEISVAEFKVVNDLNIIDISINHSPDGYPYHFKIENPDYEPEEATRKKSVWTYIGMAFSLPIVANETQADYVPTQVLSELFKTNGIDGIRYESILGKGKNVALFEVNSVEFINCDLYKTKKIAFEFEKK